MSPASRPAQRWRNQSHTTFVTAWSWCCMLWHLFTCTPSPPPHTHTHTHTHMHMHTHMNLHARQQHMTLILRHYINKKDSCTKRCTFWGVTTYHIEIRLETSGLHFLHARGQLGSYRPWHVLCNVWLHRPAFLRETWFIGISYMYTLIFVAHQWQQCQGL